MPNTELDMRSVTELLTQDPDTSLADLNADSETERNRAYAESVAQVLATCQYLDTNYSGGVIHIYWPVIQGTPLHEVAVKFVDIHEKLAEGTRIKADGLSEEQVRPILEDSGYFVLLNHPGRLTRETLSPDERDFVLLAYEHRLFEHLFGEYTLPSVFISFVASEDIETIDGTIPSTTIKSKGEVVAAMVQDFEGTVRPIGRSLSSGRQYTEWNTLTEEEVDNLERFASRLEEVYLETGYYPEESLLDRGNLGLLEDGRVVILDTNVMKRTENIPDTQTHRQLARERIPVRIYGPILDLRKQIRLYRENVGTS